MSSAMIARPHESRRAICCAVFEAPEFRAHEVFEAPEFRAHGICDVFEAP